MHHEKRSSPENTAAEGSSNTRLIARMRRMVIWVVVYLTLWTRFFECCGVFTVELRCMN
jgi:hypothetical protein